MIHKHMLQAGTVNGASRMHHSGHTFTIKVVCFFVVFFFNCGLCVQWIYYIVTVKYSIKQASIFIDKALEFWMKAFIPKLHIVLSSRNMFFFNL